MPRMQRRWAALAPILLALAATAAGGEERGCDEGSFAELSLASRPRLRAQVRRLRPLGARRGPELGSFSPSGAIQRRDRAARALPHSFPVSRGAVLGLLVRSDDSEGTRIV